MRAPDPIPTPRSAATQVPSRIQIPQKVSGSARLGTDGASGAPIDFSPQAVAQARASILPSQQSLRDQQAGSQAFTTQQQQTTQQAYAALAKILKSVAPQIGGAYHTAAVDQGMLARGYADGLAHIQSKAAAQTDAQLGAGTPQAAQAAAALGGTGSQRAVYALGGAIPGSTLAQQGAAFQSAAAALPGTAAGQGLQQIQALGAKQALTNAGFDSKQADLLAKVPGLAQTALDHLNSQYSTDQYHAATLKQGDARITQGNIRLRETIAHNKATEKTAEQRAQETSDYHQQTLAATTQYHQITVDQADSRNAAGWTRTNHYLSDPNGNPVGGKIIPTAGWHADASGNLVKDKSPTAGAKGAPGFGGLTVSGVRQLSKDADKIAGSNAALKPEQQHYVGATAVPIVGTGHAIVPYDQTLNQVFLLGPHTRKWAAKATQIATTHYLPIARQFAQSAHDARASYGDAYAKGIADGILPPKMLTAALKAVYVNDVGPYR